MQFLDIAADRDRLADHGPVVEFESRDHLERIDSRELRRLMLERGEVDLDWRDRNAFFGEENAYAARVRRDFGIVELHSSLRRPTSSTDCEVNLV